MAKMRDLSVGKGGEVMLFDPEFIKEYDDYNVRDYNSPEVIAHVRKMANVIKENGIVGFPPVTVQKVEDDVFLLAGHLRRRAFLLAKSEGADIKGIPGIVSNLAGADRVLDLLHSNDNLPLTPIEKSTIVKRLFKFGWDVKEVAKKMGISQTAVNNMVILDEAPEEVKELVREGAVSSTLVVEAIQERGEEKAVEDVKIAVETAKAEGKAKATAKHMPAKQTSTKAESKIKKVTVVKKEGLSRYLFESDKPDMFEPDPDAGDFPCSLCINNLDVKICGTCKHYINAEEESGEDSNED